MYRMMKKQLSLLALLAMGTSIAAAGTLELDRVFDQQLGYGYTENQNIVVEGFQMTDPLVGNEFLLKTPILKDAKDWAVGEYYVLLGNKPMVNYLSGEEALNLRNELLELPLYSTMDIAGEMEIKISEYLVNTGTSYYGIVVPVDDNVLYGKHSKEFCFNFGTKKFAEGEACASFEQSEAVKVANLGAELPVTSDSEEEHDAAGADMRLADISHTVEGGVLTLTWTPVPGSENLEIKLFDKEKADYISLATVPMSQAKYEYVVDATIDEYLFAFIPRDSKGKEVRVDINVREEVEMKPEVQTPPKVGPAEDMLLMAAITLALYAGYRVVRRRA